MDMWLSPQTLNALVNLHYHSLNLNFNTKKQQISFLIKWNNARTLHLAPSTREKNCRNHMIWRMSTFVLNTWGEIKNVTLFITGRLIIVFVSCGKFRGGSLTVNSSKIYPARMPALFFVHFSVRFNYLLIFNTSQSFLASLN